MQRIYSHFLSLLPQRTAKTSDPSTCERCVRVGRRTGAAKFAARRGLTLIEMLIAVTITLMVILAIVQVFQLLGTNITNGQAIIDVTTELRFVGQQLQQDLDGLTCPARTWIDPAAGLGYLEIYDGPSWDANWNYNDSIDMAPDLLEDTSMGDVDDFIALTTRNTGTPFVGRVPIGGIDDAGNPGEFIGQAESRDSEVVWWTAIVATSNTYANGDFIVNMFDLNGDGVANNAERNQSTRLSPTTSVMLFRRALLVSPGIDLAPLDPTTLSREARTLDQVLDFLDNYDVSVRWVDTDGDGIRDSLFANSLSDLTQRQNRFMHLGFDVFPQDPIPDPALAGFPFVFAQAVAGTPISQSVPPNAPTNGELAGVTYPELSTSRVRLARFPAVIPLRSLALNAQNDYAVYTQLMANSSLSDNILAFDIRCYDPGAPLFIHRDQPNVVIAPGDPAYPYDLTVIKSQVNAGVLKLSGVGAYVDLNYAHGSPISTDVDGDGINDVTSNFTSLLPGINPNDLAGWWPFYDVWSTQYERDGIDQDGVFGIDQGTNEIDDDGQNGVDDVGERETAPPYDVPLRGIKVTIRKMDYETRQTRQISVVGDFVPE